MYQLVPTDAFDVRYVVPPATAFDLEYLQIVRSSGGPTVFVATDPKVGPLARAPSRTYAPLPAKSRFLGGPRIDGLSAVTKPNVTRQLLLSLPVCALALGCGPDSPQGDEMTDIGDSDGGDDGGTGGSADDADSDDDADDGTGDESGDDDSGDGDDDDDWCWDIEDVGADGVTDAWTDGSSILAAADHQLLRYDGTAWTEYAAPESIGRLAANAPDDAWVSSWNSLFHFDGEQLTEVAVPEDVTHVRALATDETGALWMLGEPLDDCGLGVCEPLDALVYRFEVDAWVSVATPGPASALALSGSGSMWVAGQMGVARWAGNAWEPLANPEGSDFDELIVVSDDEVWAAGGSPGLGHWADGAWTYENPDDAITDFALGADGSVYRLERDYDQDVTGRRGILLRFDGAAWTQVAELESETTVVALTDGSLIVGGESGGNILERVVDPAGSAEVVAEYRYARLGGMNAMWGDTLEQTIGVDDSGLHTRDRGSWARVQRDDLGWGAFAGVAGDRTSGWAIRSENPQYHTLLWRIEDGELLPNALNLDQPHYRRVWASGGLTYVGGSVPAPGGFADTPLLLQSDGNGFADVFPHDLAASDNEVRDVYGVDGHLFVTTDAAIYEHDGAEWTRSYETDVHPNTLRAWSPDHVFVTLSDYESELMRFDGDSLAPAVNDYPELAALRAEVRLVGSEHGGLWAIGYDPSAPSVPLTIMQFDGAQWTELQLPAPSHWSLLWHPTADGIWADTGEQIWRGVPCAG